MSNTRKTAKSNKLMMSLWELKNRTMNLFKTFGLLLDDFKKGGRRTDAQTRDLQSGYLLSSYGFCGFSEVHD